MAADSKPAVAEQVPDSPVIAAMRAKRKANDEKLERLKGMESNANHDVEEVRRRTVAANQELDAEIARLTKGGK